MSALHTILAIDGRESILEYLEEMGLKLPEGFRSTHPSFEQVKSAIDELKDWSLDTSRAKGARFWCDVRHESVCTTSLMFCESSDGRGAVLAGTRGDPGLPLLRALARLAGPLVVLLNSEDPMLVEAGP